jgi:hypothetical protein
MTWAGLCCARHYNMTDYPGREQRLPNFIFETRRLETKTRDGVITSSTDAANESIPAKQILGTSAI